MASDIEEHYLLNENLMKVSKSLAKTINRQRSFIVTSGLVITGVVIYEANRRYQKKVQDEQLKKDQRYNP